MNSVYTCRRCGSKKFIRKISGSLCTQCRIFIPFDVTTMTEATWEFVEKPLTISGNATKGLLLIQKALERMV